MIPAQSATGLAGRSAARLDVGGEVEPNADEVAKEFGETRAIRLGQRWPQVRSDVRSGWVERRWRDAVQHEDVDIVRKEVSKRAIKARDDVGRRQHAGAAPVAGVDVLWSR